MAKEKSLEDKKVKTLKELTRIAEEVGEKFGKESEEYKVVRKALNLIKQMHKIQADYHKLREAKLR